MNAEDRRLGMDRPITRRDFVAGTSVAVGAALLSSSGLKAMSQVVGGAQPFAPEQAADYYPPTRTGMRGAHPGSFEAAHAARGQQAYDNRRGHARDLRPRRCRRRIERPCRRVLLPQEGRPFRPHPRPRQPRRFRRPRQAQRVRLQRPHADGDRRVGVHGGAIDVDPRSDSDHQGSRASKKDIRRTRSIASLYRSLGLQPAVFFRKEKYGEDKLVIGGGLGNPNPEFLAKTPLSAQVQADLVRLTGKRWITCTA